MDKKKKETKWKKIDETKRQFDEMLDSLPDDEDYPISFDKRDWKIVTDI